MVYSYGEGAERSGLWRGVEPVKATGTKFDAKYPVNGDTAEAAKYLLSFFHKTDMRPSIMDFKNVSEAQKKEDYITAATLKREYRTNGTEEGHALEVILNGIIAKGDWFGGLISPTTEYDDFRGTDAVIEFPDKEARGFIPRLLIDFTTSEMPEKIKQKLGKIVHGGSVRYFRSQKEKDADGAPKELSISDAPTVVLGIDIKFLPFIAGVMKQQEDLKRKAKFTGKAYVETNPFENHPLQILLLEQAFFQMSVQLDDAAKRLLNLEETMPDKSAANTLDALRFRIRNKNITPEELIKIVDELRPALAAYKTKYSGNAAVISNLLAISRWDSVSTAYQAIASKKAEIEAKKNADQILVARTWKSVSATHKLLTKLA